MSVATWNPNVQYATNDVVAYLSSYFKALVPNLGVTPVVGATWAAYSSAGTSSWSTYPAISTVNMSGNTISNVPTISSSNGIIINPGTGPITTYQPIYMNNAVISDVYGVLGQITTGWSRTLRLYTYDTTIPTNSTALITATGFQSTSNKATLGFEITGGGGGSVFHYQQSRYSSTFDSDYGLSFDINGTSNAVRMLSTDVTFSVPIKRVLNSTAITQPIIQYGTITGSGSTGSVSLTLPTAYTGRATYVVQVTMEDSPGAQFYATRVTPSQVTIGWSTAGGGSHVIMWTTLGT